MTRHEVERRLRRAPRSEARDEAFRKAMRAARSAQVRGGPGQRTRLEMEGVKFRGKRVDMAEHQFR